MTGRNKVKWRVMYRKIYRSWVNDCKGVVRMIWLLFALISIRDQVRKSDTFRIVACDGEQCANQDWKWRSDTVVSCET
jgi:hypothetical protein